MGITTLRGQPGTESGRRVLGASEERPTVSKTTDTRTPSVYATFGARLMVTTETTCVDMPLQFRLYGPPEVLR